MGTSFFVKFVMERNQYSEDELSIMTDEPEHIPSQNSIVDALEYDLMSMHEVSEELPEENRIRRAASILIVEDNNALQDQLKSYLGTNYQIYTAKNGEEGFRKTLKLIPDLIISDIMMPVMDGIRMLKEIKEKEEVCHIPIILLTAKSLIEDQIEGFEVGADAYIAKPFYMNYLNWRFGTYPSD